MAVWAGYSAFVGSVQHLFNHLGTAAPAGIELP